MRQRGYELGPWSRWVFVGVIIAVLLVIPITRRWSEQFLVTMARGANRVAVVLHLQPSVDSADGQNEVLRRTNEALLRQVATLKAGLAAAESLKEIQDFLKSTGRHGTAAAIVGYSDDPAVKTFSISIGSLDSIQVGMAVVSQDGTLVGKVVSLREHLAVVRDIHDSQSSVLGRIENSQRSQGVIRGQQGTSLQMTFIPKDEPFEVGAIVVTSGAEPLIPPGIPIGTITKTTTRPGDVFQSADVFGPVRTTSLSVVAVIRQS